LRTVFRGDAARSPVSIGDIDGVGVHTSDSRSVERTADERSWD